MVKRMKSFTVLGSYSGRNAGDAAILGATLKLLSEEFGPETRFEVPTTHPDFVIKTYGDAYNVVPIGAMPWHGSIRLFGFPTFASIKRTDATLITDGIIFDVGLFNPLFNFLIALVALVPWAKLNGRKVICLNVGIGPLRSKPGRLFAKIVGNRSDLIATRDRDSQTLFREVGVSKQIHCTADSVFAGWPAPAERVQQIMDDHDLKEGRLIGVNVTSYVDRWLSSSEKVKNKEGFLPILAKALVKLRREQGVDPVLVVTQVMDHEFAEKLAGYISDYFSGPSGDDFYPEIISNVTFTNHEIMGVCSRFNLMIGMRLHSLIIAAQSGTPVVGLVYAPKVRSFLTQLKTPQFSVELAGLGAEALGDKLVEAWKSRDEVESTQQQVVSELRVKAKEAAALVSSLFDKPQSTSEERKVAC